MPGSKSTPRSFPSESFSVARGDSGVRIRDVGMGELGIFISASIRTLVITFEMEALGPEVTSLLAQRVQENVSPT